jgi:phosphopentomutase
MSGAEGRRAIVVVLDGCGAGAAPDAADYGDAGGPSTVFHVHQRTGFHAPHLAACGFLAACGIGDAPQGRYGRLRPLGKGKDSVTGHWEMMGAVVETPFPTYPLGFPIDLIKRFEGEIGTKTLGNRPASGTQIIAELGELHQETGFPIVYTSADSVFQIAAHEAVVPIETIYDWCRVARRLCAPPNDVQRVIARPFEGQPGAYRRTERRKDFPLAPPPNLVDAIGDVLGVGVVPELFDGRGFRPGRRTQSNAEHEGTLLEALESDARFVFANFEDFDMLYGHRNDPEGFGRCLEEFDAYLGRLLPRLRGGDLLVLTADHGNDPTDASTDHSREYVPVAVVGPGLQPAGLGDLDGLTAVGATVARHLGVDWRCPGAVCLSA